MATDVDRPAVWVLGRDGFTEHPGREHDRQRSLVLVRWSEPDGLRYEHWVNVRRVTPREVAVGLED